MLILSEEMRQPKIESPCVIAVSHSPEHSEGKAE
jgi:hypothetical protein